MRVLLFLCGICLLFSSLNAQNDRLLGEGSVRQSYQDYLARSSSNHQTPPTSVTSSQLTQTGSLPKTSIAQTKSQQNFTGSHKSQGVQTVSPVYTGTANRVGFGFGSSSPIVADEETGMVAIIHGQNGGLSPNQTNYYQVDLSVNDGLSFTSELGPLADGPRFSKGSASIVNYNPTLSPNPFQSYLTYAGYTSGQGSEIVAGAFPVNTNSPLSPVATQQLLWDSLNILPTNSVVEGLPGEFWKLGVELATAGGVSGRIFVFKGTWNSATNDLDWTVHDEIIGDHNSGSFGGPLIQDAEIAFSPDGSIGWIMWLGDIFGGQNNTMQAIFVQSTDGGDTWGTPKEVSPNVEPWVADSLTAYFMEIDSTTGSLVPIGSGVASFGFEGDLTVDRNGSPHLAVLVANGSTRTFPTSTFYFLHFGYEKFLADVYLDLQTNSFAMNYVAPILTYEGSYGGGLGTLYNNHIEISRTPGGDHLFYSWIDSDTSQPSGLGFGNPNNANPNLRVTGFRVSDGYRTCIRRVTDDDPVWGGKMYYHAMAPEVLINFNQFQLPIMGGLFQGPNGNDPIDLYYFGQDIGFTPGDFQEPGTISVVWDGNNPCVPLVGLEEDDPVESLSLNCFPNPAHDRLIVEVEQAYASTVEVTLVNSLGQTVGRIAKGDQEAGHYRYPVEVGALAPGMYFVQLRAGSKVEVERLVIQ